MYRYELYYNGLAIDRASVTNVKELYTGDFFNNILEPSITHLADLYGGAFDFSKLRVGIAEDNPNGVNRIVVGFDGTAVSSELSDSPNEPLKRKDMENRMNILLNNVQYYVTNNRILVTWQSGSGNHLKAVYDGPNGTANCSFPTSITDITTGEVFDRNDLNNTGLVVELYDEPTWNGKFYRVNAKDIKGIVAYPARFKVGTNTNPNITSVQHYTDEEIDSIFKDLFGESLILEYLHPILEENQSYHIEYYLSEDGWVIEVKDSEDNIIDSVICDNEVDRDTELNYLRKDYNTIDIDVVSLTEAKHKKKKKNAFGWFSSMCGDPEKEIAFFNHIMGSDKYKSETDSSEASTTDTVGAGDVSATSGNAAAAGSGMGEAWMSRSQLINAINKLGFSYNFSSYSDAQLYRIYQERKAYVENKKKEPYYSGNKQFEVDGDNAISYYNHDIYLQSDGTYYVDGFGEFESIDAAIGVIENK